MRLLRHSKRKRAESTHTYRLRIEIVDEPDVLKRVSLLNTAVLRALMNATLKSLVEADYTEGRMEFVMESAPVQPNLAPANVQVTLLEHS